MHWHLKPSLFRLVSVVGAGDKVQHHSSSNLVASKLFFKNIILKNAQPVTEHMAHLVC